jgi:hypothetical protein
MFLDRIEGRTVGPREEQKRKSAAGVTLPRQGVGEI